MLSRSISIALLSSLIWLSSLSVGLGQPVPPIAQSVNIPHLEAKAWIDYTPYSHEAIVFFVFTTDNRDKEKVNCLNAYRDVQYVLRNSQGKVMPQDAEAWKKMPDTVTSQGMGYDCHVLPWTVKNSRAFLNIIYPTVPHGTYSLQIILAPRGSAARAVFSPIAVTL